MSRRRGEFEHRTSIFEGAFRAWSHLGGLGPDDLETKPVSDLDPLNNPIEDDVRLKSQKKGNSAAGQNPDGTPRRLYPYEPLPRSGLAHPYVQAILSPWLGPDADNDAIQLGLTTLRTWWQHRRKGESGSAIAALGTEKMKGVVEGYTRHFFTLAHCLIMNDKEQPPRTLHTKMKELEKMRSKKSKRKIRDDDPAKTRSVALTGGLGTAAALNNGMNAGGAQGTGQNGLDADLTNSSMSPLERLHAAQRRQLAESGGVRSIVPGAGDISPINVRTNSPVGCDTGEANSNDPSRPLIHIKQKCVPNKVDLPAVVEAVNHHATQLAHHGGTSAVTSAPVSGIVSSSSAGGSSSGQYGDPDTHPIVFIANNGDILLSMMIDGITCAHCVKIVETVLKGCNGNKSPIDGLLDAAADRALCSVLIKIDRISSAKRITFEAARNLAMVGYTANAKEINIVTEGPDGKKKPIDSSTIHSAMDMAARNDPRGIFNWTMSCTCPDNGVLREDCARHSQMNTAIFEAFENRGQLVTQFIQGGKLSSADTSKANLTDNAAMTGGTGMSQPTSMSNQPMDSQNQHEPIMSDQFQQTLMNGNGMGHHQGMGHDNMGYYGGSGNNMGRGPHVPSSVGGGMSSGHGMDHHGNNHHSSHHHGSSGMGQMPMRASMAQRASIISFGGNGLRSMSFASEAASFGRAMSGLSALSIDWENMDDFDINVDHSSHITNESPANGRFSSGVNDSGPPETVGVTVTGGPSGSGSEPGTMGGGAGGGMAPPGGRGGRRSSIRRSFIGGSQDAHVSFKV